MAGVMACQAFTEEFLEADSAVIVREHGVQLFHVSEWHTSFGRQFGLVVVKRDLIKNEQESGLTDHL